MSFPKVEIEKMTLIESQYEDYEGNIYSALKLIEQSKKYNSFKLPLAGICINHLPFQINNLEDFLFQVKRLEDTDLQYPIILDSKGQIADGWHRVSKAIYEGKETIEAIRLEEMPAPDSKVEEDG